MHFTRKERYLWEENMVVSYAAECLKGKIWEGSLEEEHWYQEKKERILSAERSGCGEVGYPWFMGQTTWLIIQRELKKVPVGIMMEWPRSWKSIKVKELDLEHLGRWVSAYFIPSHLWWGQGSRVLGQDMCICGWRRRQTGSLVGGPNLLPLLALGVMG